MKNIFKKHKDYDEEDGGTRVCGGIHRSWESGAPKVIESHEITHFELEFSLVSYVLNDDEDKDFCGYFELECDLDGDRVVGKYATRKRFDGGKNVTFETDKNFLKELDKVIHEEDVIRFNGYTSRTAGLPDMFGDYLDVDFASGENLYTSNNQSIDLPMSALRRFKKVFESALDKPQAVAPPTDDEPEDFDAGWMCECGVVNAPGTHVCSACGKDVGGEEPVAECICGLKFYGDAPKACPICGAPQEDFM